MTTIILLKQFFGWCAAINLVLLFFWFLLLTFARGFVYRMHVRWFKIPRRFFNMVNYSSLVFFKIGVLIFNVIPYVVLVILTR